MTNISDANADAELERLRTMLWILHALDEDPNFVTVFRKWVWDNFAF
jgi:hypothetical protein